MEQHSPVLRYHIDVPLIKNWSSIDASPALLHSLPEAGSVPPSHASGQFKASHIATPLNPVFATLTANGVIGPPAVQLSSLPSSFHSNFQPSTSRQQFPNIDVLLQPSASGQWTESSLSYNPPLTFPIRPSVPRPSSGQMKAKASITHYTPIRPRPFNKAQIPGSTDERRVPGRYHPLRRTHSDIVPFYPPLNAGLIPPLDYLPPYPLTIERSMAGLPPSLWMSPALTTPATAPAQLQSPGAQTSSTRNSFIRSPISPTSPTSGLFTDIFSDNPFSVAGPSQGASPFPSPQISGSDLQSSVGPGDIDPVKLQKEESLATQVWKMYAKTKASLPHAQRTENLNW